MLEPAAARERLSAISFQPVPLNMTEYGSLVSGGCGPRGWTGGVTAVGKLGLESGSGQQPTSSSVAAP